MPAYRAHKGTGSCICVNKTVDITIVCKTKSQHFCNLIRRGKKEGETGRRGGGGERKREREREREGGGGGRARELYHLNEVYEIIRNVDVQIKQQCLPQTAVTYPNFKSSSKYQMYAEQIITQIYIIFLVLAISVGVKSFSTESISRLHSSHTHTHTHTHTRTRTHTHTHIYIYIYTLSLSLSLYLIHSWISVITLKKSISYVN